MASGSSGRNNAGSKGYDFASDDLLVAYEDYGNQDGSNGSHADPVTGANSGKEFHKVRMARSSPPFQAVYNQQDDSLNQEMIATVEKTMKKYSDNLLRFLEGLSSRLSQLELYCYNLDKSIGEMRSDLVRDHGESESKLKSLDKHLQEVHRSVQILRDKQELAETQKELAKLHLVQKESSTTTPSQQTEERPPPPASEPKKPEHPSEMHNQRLALALPHQVAPQPPQQQPVVPPSQPMPQTVAQPQNYYLPPPSQIPNQPQYPQMPPQPQVTQAPPPQATQFPPQYTQQWTQQQFPQPVQPPQQPAVQPQIRPESIPVYPLYSSSQPTTPSPPENLPSSMPMQVSFSGIPQQYGYGGPTSRTVQRPPPQPQPPTQPQASIQYTTGSGYMMYENEGGRAQIPHQQPRFPQGGGGPSGGGYLQNPNPASNPHLMVRTQNPPPQFMLNHPYNDVIEKLVSMGYRGDHVAHVIQRMEENGQTVDFNAVLDRLNVHPSGGSQRGGWSG